MPRYFEPAPGNRDTARAFGWLGWLFVVVLALGLMAYTLRWVFVPLDTVGPENMRHLSQQANNHYQSLESQRASIRTQQQRIVEFERLYGQDRTIWPQGKRQEYQQLADALRNLTTAYNLSCGQYKALWRDEWRDVPAPNDLPRTCDLIQ